VTVPRLREMISERCRLLGNTQSEGTKESVELHVPRWLPEALLARGKWRPHLRELAGIVEAPALRPDGSVLSRPGFDEETGLLYLPSEEFPTSHADVREADVRAAYGRLCELVAQFPFAGDCHRAAWFSGLFSLVGRTAVDGPVPMHLFDANSAGAGKSLLVDLIGIIATALELARYSYTAEQGELSKQLLAVALGGDVAILFDNCDGGAAIGGPALDRVLTAATIRGRLLGQTRMITMPWRAVVFVTGNNIQVRGDAHRRAILCRLETADEHPEERTGFAIPDLLAHARENRPALYMDALTILRGYLGAGKPKPDGWKPLGGFGAWSDIVRGAVAWVSGFDPVATRGDLSSHDRDSAQRHAFVAAWERFRVFDRTGRDGLTATEVLSVLRGDKTEADEPAMREALAGLATSGLLPSACRLGQYLAKIRDRNTDGKRITASADPRSKIMHWRVEDVPESQPPQPGIGACVPDRPAASTVNAAGVAGVDSRPVPHLPDEHARPIPSTDPSPRRGQWL
jgi:putative DNA primase/helicase